VNKILWLRVRIFPLSLRMSAAVQLRAAGHARRIVCLFITFLAPLSRPSFGFQESHKNGVYEKKL